MNAPENIAPKASKKTAIFVASAAVALCVLGIGVIFSWHNIHSFGEIRNLIIFMAYNTAICMITAGFSLLALMRKKLWLIQSCAEL